MGILTQHNFFFFFVISSILFFFNNIYKFFLIIAVLTEMCEKNFFLEFLVILVLCKIWDVRIYNFWLEKKTNDSMDDESMWCCNLGCIFPTVVCMVFPIVYECLLNRFNNWCTLRKKILVHCKSDVIWRITKNLNLAGI